MRSSKPPRESKSKYDRTVLTEPTLRFLQKYGVSHAEVIESRVRAINERDGLNLPVDEMKPLLWDIATAFNTQTMHVLNGPGVENPANPETFGELKERFNVAEQSLPGELGREVPKLDSKFYPLLQQAYGWMADLLTMQVQRNLKGMAKEA